MASAPAFQAGNAGSIPVVRFAVMQGRSLKTEYRFDITNV